MLLFGYALREGNRSSTSQNENLMSTKLMSLVILFVIII